MSLANKSITPSVRELLKTLAVKTNSGLGEVFQREEILSIFKGIEECNAPMAIGDLIPYALHDSDLLHIPARRTIGALACRIPPDDLPAFDGWIRSSSAISWFAPWNGLSPRDVPAFTKGEYATGMLGVLSAHRSGYVREMAVRELRQIRNGGEFGFLLVRSNDWVPVIREDAEAAVRDRIISKNAEGIVRCLPLIVHLGSMGRVDHDTVIATAVGILRQPECKGILFGGLRSSDRRTRRACYRVVAEMEASEAEPFLCDLLLNSDSILRFHASRRLLHSVEAVRLPHLYSVCSRDYSMPIRRAALDEVVARIPSTVNEYLTDALLDRHFAVRDLARFYSRKRDGFDARNFYREKVAAGGEPKLAAAISGLGETGNTNDFELLQPFLSSNSIAVRKVALVAGTRLEPGKMVPILLQALIDTSTGISKTAQRAMSLHMSLVSANDLAPMLEREMPAYVRKNALGLGLRLSKWDRLPPALRLYADEDPKIASLAQAGVSAWLNRYNRSQSKPSAVQLDASRQALEKAKWLIGKKQYSELQAILTQWEQP